MPYIMNHTLIALTILIVLQTMLAKGSLFEPSTRILSPPIRDDGVNESHLSKDQGDGVSSFGEFVYQYVHNLLMSL